MMKAFFLVLARDERFVGRKIEELKGLGVPYLVVCGQKLDHSGVIYREPKGKYDAINFGFGLIPRDIDVVALNDVDTRIYNLQAALRLFSSDNVDMVFAAVMAVEGPQQAFLPMLRRLRKILAVAPSGDLMLMRYDALRNALPIMPCKAEDSYLLFRLLAQNCRVIDCEECYVLGEKTRNTSEEAAYKERTVTGVYQALAAAHPPARIRFFYALLPFISPMLLMTGKKGYSWMKGIIRGFTGYMRGDRRASW